MANAFQIVPEARLTAWTGQSRSILSDHPGVNTGNTQEGPVWSAVCLNLGDTRYPPFHGYVSTTPYECGTKTIWSSTKDFRAPNLEFSVAGTSIFFTGNLASEDPRAWLLDATSMIGLIIGYRIL